MFKYTGNYFLLGALITMDQVRDRNRISWVLSYIQGGVVEIWKDNILDEITNGTLVVHVRVTGVEDSRRFLRELDEAPGGNNLHYILQYLCVPALVTRV